MVTALTNAPANTIGLTSAVSGLLTKPSVTLWSNGEPRASYACVDVTEEARSATSVRAVDPDLVGSAVILGATVVPGRSGELTTIALVESSSGIRSVVQCDRPEVGERFLTTDPVGIAVICGPAGVFLPA
jgi:hypothetical protein